MHLRAEARRPETPHRLASCSMGMGEPMHNLGHRESRRSKLLAESGLGALGTRAITVSTSVWSRASIAWPKRNLGVHLAPVTPCAR